MFQFRRAFLGLGLSLTLLLGACSSMSPQPRYQAPDNLASLDTSNKDALLDLHQVRNTGKKDDKSTNPMRLEAIKEAALTLGAQGALAHRSHEIDDMLENRHGYLDQSFNFDALVLANGILPPVIEEGRQTFNLADNDTIRIADQHYQIVKQARFVTAAPNWRQYLWLDYHKPDVPEYPFLPREDVEEEIATWKRYLEEGWQQGTQQANVIFHENLARLRRDFQGMALYRKLLDQNMISQPYVAKTELGITGGGESLTINDRVKRISQHPQLNPDGDSWKPAVANPMISVAQSDLGPMPEANLAPTMAPHRETEMSPRDYVK